MGDERAEDEFADELEQVGRELTSGPPCRRCQYPMEPGFLVVRSGQPVTTEIRWADPAEGQDRPGDAAEGALPWGPYGAWHALKGFRCPECRRFELDYGSPPARPSP